MNFKVRNIRTINEWYNFWQNYQDNQVSRQQLLERILQMEKLRQEFSGFQFKISVINESFAADDQPDLQELALVLLSDLIDQQKIHGDEINQLLGHKTLILMGLRMQTKALQPSLINYFKKE